MLRWTRWWLTLIVVAGMCFHIVKAAQAPEPRHANFRTVPKLNGDGTRDVDLPTVRGYRHGPTEPVGWLDMMFSLLRWQQDIDTSLMKAPNFDMGDYEAAPRVRSRDGTLSKVTTRGTQNSTFGGLQSR